MDLLTQIKNKQIIVFNDLINLIDTNYNFIPNEFKNGDLINKENENNGSNKVFAFAKIHKFDKEQALHCFGEYYQDVLNTPNNNDHQNIRNFIKFGWDGINQQENILIKK